MAENLSINAGSKEEKYRELLPQLYAFHAYGKVYIPHYFGEHNGRNLRNLHGLIILSVVETNKRQLARISEIPVR